MQIAFFLVLLACWLLSVQGLYIWKPSSVVQEQMMHHVVLGDYISRELNFNGSEKPTPTQNGPATLRIKRMALSPRQIKRTNDFNIATASPPHQTDSMAIDDYGIDHTYFSALTFGSKTLLMLIDTGAANSWVMGSDCTSTACNTHTTFGEADSNTLQVSQEPFSLSYGTGAVNGVIVSDTVGFANKKVKWSFGSASNTSADFDTIPIDGILGLGRAKSNAMSVPTFMEAVSDAGLFPANLFGVYLQREADGSTNGEGEVNFGSPDVTKYTGDLSYTDTVANGAYWEIPVDDVVVNGIPCNLTGNTAIIDTGTTFMLLPPDDAKQIHNSIPGIKHVGESYNIPCNTSVSIQIVFSGKAYNISPKDYISGSVAGGDLCSSNIIGVEVMGANQWLLGDTFLKNVYAVFDIDQSRIGFGVKGTTSFSAGSPATTSMMTSSTSPTVSSMETQLSSDITSKITSSSSSVVSSLPAAPSTPLLSIPAALVKSTSTNVAVTGSSTTLVSTAGDSIATGSGASSAKSSADTSLNGKIARYISNWGVWCLLLFLAYRCWCFFLLLVFLGILRYCLKTRISPTPSNSRVHSEGGI